MTANFLKKKKLGFLYSHHAVIHMNLSSHSPSPTPTSPPPTHPHHKPQYLICFHALQCHSVLILEFIWIPSQLAQNYTLTLWTDCIHQVYELHSCKLYLTVHDRLLCRQFWYCVKYAILIFLWSHICQKESQVCHIHELRHIEQKLNPLPKARFPFTLPDHGPCWPLFLT